MLEPTTNQQFITGKVIQIRHANDAGTFTVGQIEVSTLSDLSLVEEDELREELVDRYERAVRMGDLTRYEKFKFFGAVSQNDTVTLKGKWVDDDKWGVQFVAQHATFQHPIDEEGLITYLSESDKFKGFGRTGTKARKLVRHFGIDPNTDLFDSERFDAGLTNADHNLIAKVCGISLEDATNLRLIWIRDNAVNAISSQLAHYELTASQIERIVGVYQDAALSVLKTNPYKLIGEVEGFGFATIDKIALRVGVKKTDPKRIEAGIYYTVLLEEEDGHTWVDRGVLVERSNKVLILDCEAGEARGLIEGGIEALLIIGQTEQDSGALWVKSRVDPSSKGLYQDMGGRVGLAIAWAMESLISDTVLLRGSLENPHFKLAKREDGKLDEGYEANKHDEGFTDTYWSMCVFENPELKDIFDGMNAGQVNALGLSLTSSCVAITGAAGSGKTTLIDKLLSAYSSKGLEVAICAPTGKATKRLQEVLSVVSCSHRIETIHRLLGYNGTSFLVNQIEADVIIIDEMSMVDVPLFASLCNRLRPHTCLVLVGDIDQLPPVGAGNVLRDIIAGELCPIARLSQVVRQSGVLKRNCLKLLEGKIAPQEEEAGTKPWIVMDKEGEAEKTQKKVVEMFDKHIHRLGFDLLYEVQLLTAQKDGPLGVHELNRELQKVYQKKRGVEIGRETLFDMVDSDTVKPLTDNETKSKVPRSFYVGDRVIYTRNNYDLDVYNGDVGVVREVVFKRGHDGDMSRIESVGVEFGAKGEPRVEQAPDSVGAGDWPTDHTIMTSAMVVKNDGMITIYSNFTVIPRKHLKDLQLAYALTVHKYQGSQIPCVVLIVHKAHSYMHNGQGRNWVYTGATRAQKCLVMMGDGWGTRNAVSRVGTEKRRTWMGVWREERRSLGIEVDSKQNVLK